MKKKIYAQDGCFVHVILNNLEGSESVYDSGSFPNQNRVEGDRVINNIYHISIYHINPEGVTVCCYSTLNYSNSIGEDYREEEIWLHGAEQAFGKLETRILENIHQYCEDPMKYVEEVVKKDKNKSPTS